MYRMACVVSDAAGLTFNHLRIHFDEKSSTYTNACSWKNLDARYFKTIVQKVRAGYCVLAVICVL